MTPERTQLAQAIRRYNDLAAYLARAREARLSIAPDFGAVGEAEEALREAEANAPRQRLGTLLGEKLAEATVEQAQANLDAANAALEAARRDEQLVDQEIRRLEEQLRFAELGRHTAMRAVAIVEPQIARMVEALHATRAHVLTLEAALTEASKLDLVENRFWRNERFYQADLALAARWRAAIAALTLDAATPLPGDDTPPPQQAKEAA